MRIPKDIYPGQTLTTDPNYPHGKARNETAVGARDGFPLEEKWVNDLLGWMQALMSSASLTPDGTAEKVGASQLLEAIEYIATHTTFEDGANIRGLTVLEFGIAVVSGGFAVTGDSSMTGDLNIVGDLTANTVDIAAIPTLSPAVEVVRPQPLIAMHGISGGVSEIPGDWNFQIGWVQQTSAADLYFPITDVPDGATLKSVRVMIDGNHTNLGGFSALPGGMPTLRVEYVDSSGTVQTPTPTATDSSGTVGAFNTSHTITCTLDTPITIDHASAPKAIYARFDGAEGANFVANRLGIQRLDAIFDANQVNP